eukprot:194691_1
MMGLICVEQGRKKLRTYTWLRIGVQMTNLFTDRVKKIDEHFNPRLQKHVCKPAKRTVPGAKFLTQPLEQTLGSSFCLCKICLQYIPTGGAVEQHLKSKKHLAVKQLNDSQICANFNNGGICAEHCTKAHVCSICRCMFGCRLHCFIGKKFTDTESDVAYVGDLKLYVPYL